MDAADRNQVARIERRAKREGWSAWIRDHRDRHALLEGCRFDMHRANMVRRFFERVLRVQPSGAPKPVPFVLHPYQWEDIIGPLFGWVRPHPDDPDRWVRRYRVANIWIPKKHGKSLIGGGIALTLLCVDDEPLPEIYLAAPTKSATRNVMQPALNMVDWSPALQQIVEPRPYYSEIKHPGNKGIIKAVANEPRSTEGVNAHGVITDEVHMFRDGQLFDSLRDSGIAREQPLQVEISTAGQDRESHGFERYQYAKRVIAGEHRGGVTDTYTLAVVYEAAPGDDITDEAVMRKANPGIGYTIRLDDLKRTVAQTIGTLQETNTKRRRFNIWAQSAQRFIDLDRWDRCADPSLSIDDFAGRRCWLGLDGSSREDLTSLVASFPPEHKGEPLHVFPFYWLPKDALAKREQQDDVGYLTWESQGHLFTTEGDFIDLDAVVQWVAHLRDRFAVEELSVDLSFIASIIPDLQALGLNVFEFSQADSMMSPVMYELERLILEERIRHASHPILNWNASNLEKQDTPKGYIKPVKPKRKARIDGMIALMQTLGNLVKAAAADPEPYDGENPEDYLL